MRDDWLDSALAMCGQKAAFYSGARKILRGRSVLYRNWENDLTLADCGYTKSKMTMLHKYYLHEESRAEAMRQWEARLGKAKYGSVGFHTYNHLVKGHEGSSKRASVMGPCIQSVCLTLQNNKRTGIDIFYRTTEYFKKFPADLVFVRDVLLEGFELDVESVRFHFANITLHPMYFVTIIPLLDHPVADLEDIRSRDKYFFDWIVKWTARYLCPEHNRGIAKFAQAMRVHDDAHSRIEKSQLRSLIKYLNDHHPGYRKEYVDPDEDDE
jgi:hypothetical protein